VCGDEHETFSAAQCCAQRCVLHLVRPLGDCEKRIDHGVSREEDLVSGHVFTEQVLPRFDGRREVQIRADASQAAKQLFGVRSPLVMAAQPRLHVAYQYALEETNQCCEENGSSVALHEDHRRLVLAHDFAEPIQAAVCDVVQVLTFTHDAEIPVHREVEDLQHLIHERRVLPRECNARLDFTVLLESARNRSELDAFRPRADREQNPGGLCHRVVR
jgi:hypothetical protein